MVLFLAEWITWLSVLLAAYGTAFRSAAGDWPMAVFGLALVVLEMSVHGMIRKRRDDRRAARRAAR